jgi:hypothetical protein
MLVNNWFTAKSIEDLLQNNLNAITGKGESPFMFINPNKSPLHNDTLPNMNTIIEINKKGFLTNDSQPSCYEEMFVKLPGENYCGFIEEHDNKDLNQFKLNEKEEELYKCLMFQKAYCGGFIHKDKFDLFRKNIGDNYNIYYYNYYTKECEDGFENLTYYEYYNQIHYTTNFRNIKGFAENDLYFFSKYVNNEILETIKKEMIFIDVIDKDYNTGKNIYEDILKFL